MSNNLPHTSVIIPKWQENPCESSGKVYWHPFHITFFISASYEGGIMDQRKPGFVFCCKMHVIGQTM